MIKINKLMTIFLFSLTLGSFSFPSWSVCVSLENSPKLSTPTQNERWDRLARVGKNFFNSACFNGVFMGAIGAYKGYNDVYELPPAYGAALGGAMGMQLGILTSPLPATLLSLVNEFSFHTEHKSTAQNRFIDENKLKSILLFLERELGDVDDVQNPLLVSGNKIFSKFVEDLSKDLNKDLRHQSKREDIKTILRFLNKKDYLCSKSLFSSTKLFTLSLALDKFFPQNSSDIKKLLKSKAVAYPVGDEEMSYSLAVKRMYVDHVVPSGALDLQGYQFLKNDIKNFEGSLLEIDKLELGDKITLKENHPLRKSGVDCPICLEENQLIMDCYLCGHGICANNCSRINRMKTHSHSEFSSRCPVCRTPHHDFILRLDGESGRISKIP